jgi:hypothetical protein
MESAMTGHPSKHADAVAKKPKPSAQEQEKKKKHTNELLDEALDETFPASDPVAMLEPVPNSKRSGSKKK